MVKRLGFPRWKRLHRLIYVATAAGVTERVIARKPGKRLIGRGAGQQHVAQLRPGPDRAVGEADLIDGIPYVTV